MKSFNERIPIQKIFAGMLVNPGSVKKNVLIEISEGRVISIRPQAESMPESGDIDVRNSTVIPGLIDIHIHGAAGDDFGKGEVDKASGYLASQGTTSFLATAYPSGEPRTFIDNIQRLRQKLSPAA